MAELLRMFKDSLWFSSKKGVTIDSTTFKTFSQLTPSLMVLGSVIVTARQFFGQPIKCDPGGAANEVNGDVLESYCWMYAHFDIPGDYVGPCAASVQKDMTGPIYNYYYQWVPIYLVFMAILFYLPRYFWLLMEGGLMKFFGKGTTTRFIEDPEEKKDRLVKFFKDNVHNKYNIYYFGFIFCEFLNLVVVCGSLLLTDRFLQNRFLYYGFEVWFFYRLPPEEQRLQAKMNPMCYTFPRIVACDYFKFGGAGGENKINALCILSLNIINDKVFLVLWWWFLFLIFMGILRVIYRCIQVNSARLRFSLLNLRMHRYFKRNENMIRIRDYIYVCSRGDWFVIYQLSKNLNRPFFMDFLVTLSRQIDPNPEAEVCSVRNHLLDTGDDIMDMMLKPNLANYESKEDGKGSEEE